MTIEIPGFSITIHPADLQYPEGMVWIENEIGEGMGIHMKEFKKLISDYFEENF